jgi:hypothetical protein
MPRIPVLHKWSLSTRVSEFRESGTDVGSGFNIIIPVLTAGSGLGEWMHYSGANFLLHQII